MRKENIFGAGSPTHLTSSTVLLNEVQKQRQLLAEHQRANEKQQSTIEQQQSTTTRQQAEIQDLAARLAKLEAVIAGR